MPDYSVIGKSVIRKDALDKVTGAAKFTPDIMPEGFLHGRILGSAYAHAIIKKIDTSKAEALPGVKAVITGAEAPDRRTGYIEDRHILCKERVRYVGDPIAAVAATTAAVAEQAIDLIEVEYETLPAIFDPEDAMKETKNILHENLPDYKTANVPNLIYRLEPDMPNVFLHRQIRHGDIHKGFAESDYIYEGRYTLPRVHQCPMEPHSSVVKCDANGDITIWACEQGGVRQKYFISNIFGFDSSKVRLIVPYVGGGFGGKCDLVATPINVMLAMKSKRPVKLEMSREESFLHGNPRSPAIIYIKDGYKKDGTLMAREIREIINGGAYNGHVSVLVNDGAYGATGTYKVPHMNLDAYGVYTNTPATGPYRALGSELLTFAMECQFERVADQLGIDKYEIRRKNLLRDGDIDPNGQIVYNNSTIQALDKVVEFIQWGKPVPQLEKPWVVGRGISVGNKYTMSGSASVAISKIHDDGVIEIRHYQIELGQGCNTILAQVAAEEFNVPAEKIKIVFDDSAFCPFDHGTFCSRGTFMNGNAVRLACQDVKKKLFARAAEEMGVPADKLDTKNSMIFEKTNPDNAIPFGKLFNYGGWTLGSGELIGSAAYYYPLGKMDPETGQGNPVAYYSYGALGMDVAVNTETGEIRLLKVCGWYDPGQILNRGNIDGQIHGAFSMGVGQALFEEMKFNDEGKCINPNFRDYRIPTMLDIPYKDITTVGYVGEPHKEGPYGAKGIGEVSLVPVMPVVANAINNALGVQINDLPITRERVLFAIKEKG